MPDPPGGNGYKKNIILVIVTAVLLICVVGVVLLASKHSKERVAMNSTNNSGPDSSGDLSDSMSPVQPENPRNLPILLNRRKRSRA